MPAPKAERNDVAIAQKAINLHRDLSGADKAVASAIIDHFNKKTGQCDPSLERLATLLGIAEKTVRRATVALCAAGLFWKSSHGGNSGRASYTPNWSAFRTVVQEWDARMRSGGGPVGGSENRTNMSGAEASSEGLEPDISVPRTGHFCPVEPDKNVRQTHLINPSYEPIDHFSPSERDAATPETSTSEQPKHGLLRGENRAPKPPNYEAREKAATKGCSHRQAAESAATYRINAAIAGRSREWREAMNVYLNPEDLDAAVIAEVKRRHEGIAYLDACIRMARLDAGRHVHVH